MNNEILLIFGRKRTRKTRLALMEMRRRNRVLYIDPKGASRGRHEYAFGVECRTPAAVKELTERGGNFSVRVAASDPHWVSLLCKQAIHVEACTVGIDEIQRFSDQWRSCQGIYEVLEDGGASAVSLIGVTHRPTDIEIDITAAADRIITFQQTHSSDIKRLQHYIEADDEVFIDLSAPSEENPMRISEYIEWRVDWGRHYEIKTYDGKICGISDRKGQAGNRDRDGNGNDPPERAGETENAPSTED